MSFHELVNAAAGRLGLDGGVGPDTQALEVQFQEGDPVRIEHLESRRQLSLVGLIGFYPPQAQQASLFETLLHAHTYGLMTDGCMFATDPDAGKIILFKTLSVDDLDADRLVQAVQDFRLVQRTWKRAYADGRLLTEPASGTAGAVPMGDLA